MFNNASGISFTYSGTVSAAQSSDFPIVRGITSYSYKITFATAGTCNFNFTALTGHDDITFYLYRPSSQANVSISINSKIYAIDNIPGWKRLVFNTQASTSQISIISDSPVVLFVDKIGGRKVRYEMDDDIVADFVSQISVSTGVSTTLSADLSGRVISLSDKSKFTDSSKIQIGADVLQLTDLSTMQAASPNPHLTGETVNLLCPTVFGENKSLPNPCISVSVYDNFGMKERATIHTKDGQVNGVKLSSTGIAVAVVSKVHFGKLKRQYEQKYGDNFFIFIDGEKRQVLSESDTMGIKDNGNNSHVYFYRVQPPIFRDIQYYNITSREITVGAGTL